MKVLDLFSGIGGFSLGLERAGMETVAFCEMDGDCQKVLNKHWPTIHKFSDVKNLKYKNGYLYSKLKDYNGIHTEIDVICGGFPCQDVSVAGNKKGFKDELGQETRSGLWKEFKRLIKETEPRYAIIENVANLRSLGLNQVIKDLWQIGYACEWHIISARSVGAPHLRERIWIIAHANSDRREQGISLSTENKEKSLQPIGDGKEQHVHNTANANNFRFWKPFASQKESSRWWSKATTSVSHWKEAQSIVCGVDDGISRGMDRSRKQRIKQLGNSIVPQIPEIIGKALVEHEESLK